MHFVYTASQPTDVTRWLKELHDLADLNFLIMLVGNNGELKHLCTVSTEEVKACPSASLLSPSPSLSISGEIEVANLPIGVGLSFIETEAAFRFSGLVSDRYALVVAQPERACTQSCVVDTYPSRCVEPWKVAGADRGLSQGSYLG